MNTTTVRQPEQGGVTSAPEPHVRTVGLCKRFDPTGPAAVEGLDLEIGRGEMFGLLGPSGCGKSTTLNMLAGFLEPTAGEVVVDGRVVNDVPSYRRGIALVFQNYALFPHLSAADNVGFGLKVRRTARDKARRRVEELLDLVGLGPYADKLPSQLSGGQQQRVAIARALAIDPEVILLDEPLSNLDARLRAEMRVELKRILRAAGVTVVLVTHDQSEAFSVCDRVALMLEGRLETVSTPRDLYLRPTSHAAAQFIGEGTFLPGVVTTVDPAGGLQVAGDAGGPLLPATSVEPVAAGAGGTVFVRPELLRLCDAESDQALLSGVVDDVSYLGETVAYLVATDRGRAQFKTLSHGVELVLGQRVGLTWSAGDALFLPTAEDRSGSFRPERLPSEEVPA